MSAVAEIVPSTAELPTDPMGAAGEPTKSQSTPAVASADKPKKTRAPKGEDTDAPRRASLVEATFGEALKVAGATPESARDAAIKKLLVRMEGKEGVKFKPVDFAGTNAGGKKTFYYLKKAFYLARAQECQDRIDGKTAAKDPAAAMKKAAKLMSEVEKLKAQLQAAGIDISALGV